jgi:4-hydroxy-2-oxoheptanedioate aldolase
VIQVSTAEKAKEIVADSRFAPLGRRGLGSPFAPAIWGLSASEYVKSANESILVMVQIETKEGVDNVKAITETAGIGLIQRYLVDSGTSLTVNWRRRLIHRPI